MKIRISNTYPPNIEAIRDTFGADNLKHAVYTYGNTMHVPNKHTNIEAHLIEHEEMHVTQQGEDPAAWWDRYLADPEFRLQQELEAYRAQYQFIAEHHDRKTRRYALRHIAKDLASSMYGNVVTAAEAEALITAKD